MPRTSKLEEDLALQIRAVKLTTPHREFRFHPTRRWRFDFAWPPERIAVEVEGGVYSGGRHTRGKGFEGDCEKLNSATLRGWRVFRFTGKQIKSGYAIGMIEGALDKVAKGQL